MRTLFEHKTKKNNNKKIKDSPRDHKKKNIRKVVVFHRIIANGLFITEFGASYSFKQKSALELSLANTKTSSMDRRKIGVRVSSFHIAEAIGLRERC